MEIRCNVRCVQKILLVLCGQVRVYNNANNYIQPMRPFYAEKCAPTLKTNISKQLPQDGKYFIDLPDKKVFSRLFFISRHLHQKVMCKNVH